VLPADRDFWTIGVIHRIEADADVTTGDLVQIGK